MAQEHVYKYVWYLTLLMLENVMRPLWLIVWHWIIHVFCEKLNWTGLWQKCFYGKCSRWKAKQDIPLIFLLATVSVLPHKYRRHKQFRCPFLTSRKCMRAYLSLVCCCLRHSQTMTKINLRMPLCAISFVSHTSPAVCDLNHIIVTCLSIDSLEKKGAQTNVIM